MKKLFVMILPLIAVFCFMLFACSGGPAKGSEVFDAHGDSGIITDGGETGDDISGDDDTSGDDTNDDDTNDGGDTGEDDTTGDDTKPGGDAPGGEDEPTEDFNKIPVSGSVLPDDILMVSADSIVISADEANACGVDNDKWLALFESKGVKFLWKCDNGEYVRIINPLIEHHYDTFYAQDQAYEFALNVNDDDTLPFWDGDPHYPDSDGYIVFNVIVN